MPLITDAEAWTRVLASAGLPPLQGRGGDPQRFRGRLRVGRLGAVRVAEFVTPAGECFRDASTARRQDAELCQVEFITRGQARLEQDGHEVNLSSGDLVVIDPSQPLTVTTTALHHLTVLVPRYALRIEAEDVTRLSLTRIPGAAGSGALLSSLAHTAAQTMGTFGAEEASRSGTAISDLVSVVLNTRLPRARMTRQERTRAGIEAFIEANLHRPELDPASVAASQSISVRSLHLLFRGHPHTVAGLIRHRRLERCRTDLSGGDHSVATLATRYGFSSPAHLSRLFKAAYGCTPTDYRRGGPDVLARHPGREPLTTA